MEGEGRGGESRGAVAELVGRVVVMGLWYVCAQVRAHKFVILGIHPRLRKLQRRQS